MNQAELEIILQNEDDMRDVEGLLDSINVKKTGETRDPATAMLVVGVVANVLAIVASLMQIRDSFRNKKKDVIIIIRDIEMNELDIMDSDEEQIKSFVERSTKL